jgi:RHS repeat-associated protein
VINNANKIDFYNNLPLYHKSFPLYSRRIKTRRKNILPGEPGAFSRKELDAETGLYYYGARYLDPRTSRWLSGDPALGEYVPDAPVNEEARKRNGNLPGMGGVFNVVNLHVYHYAGNNPVKYTDPDGAWIAFKKQADRFNGYLGSGARTSVRSDYSGPGFGNITITNLEAIRKDAETSDRSDLGSRGALSRDISSTIRDFELHGADAEKYEKEETARYEAFKSIREKSTGLNEINNVLKNAEDAYNRNLPRVPSPEDKKRADDAANEIIDNFIRSKNPSYNPPVEDES